MAKHVLKFSAIANFFSRADETRLIARGENAVESNHIKSFHFIADLRLFRGEVHASMRDRVYKVEVYLDDGGEIKNCTCNCPRGQYLCHHVAAICIYGHNNVSITDVESRWDAKKSKNVDVKTIDEIYGSKSHKSTDRNLSAEEVDEFRNSLKQFGTAVGFTWLLCPEPTIKTYILPDIEAFLFSDEYCSSDAKEEFFRNSIQVSLETIRFVCESTIGQANNENWLVCRKNRLTASNFGVLLAAIGRNRYPPSLFKRLTGFYNLQGISAVQWGTVNEATALSEFTSATNLEVVPTGLWLDTCGYLGGSPDGLVGDKSLIEVKCPFKYREKALMTELKIDRSYILSVTNEDEVILNENHEYYHQIQGNLFITGRESCYLMIWTPKHNIIFEVKKNIHWEPNLELLKKFYIEQYLPYIIGTAIVE